MIDLLDAGGYIEALLKKHLPQLYADQCIARLRGDDNARQQRIDQSLAKQLSEAMAQNARLINQLKEKERCVVAEEIIISGSASPSSWIW